jgi:hypothetical protein
MKILSFFKNLFSKKVKEPKVEKVEDVNVNWEAAIETKVEEPVVEEPVVEEPVVETAKDIKSGVKSKTETPKRKYNRKKTDSKVVEDVTSPEVPVTKSKRKYNKKK